MTMRVSSTTESSNNDEHLVDEDKRRKALVQGGEYWQAEGTPKMGAGEPREVQHHHEEPHEAELKQDEDEKPRQANTEERSRAHNQEEQLRNTQHRSSTPEVEQRNIPEQRRSSEEAQAEAKAKVGEP